MYHNFSKNSVHLRNAIYNVYNHKCVYCGKPLQYREMCIDHILPVNMPSQIDTDTKSYIDELTANGFICDSIENYLPCCSSCNISKSNKIYTSSNLRFYHEQARSQVDRILALIQKSTDEDTYYEPVDNSIWEEIDFSNQHDLSYAIMGYRLTHLDVKACPHLPQVNKIKKQLQIVDYVFVSGETGCGKSISAYQAAFDYYNAGWHVYRFVAHEFCSNIIIPQNTEEALYVIDDAQHLQDYIIEKAINQTSSNLKIIICKTTNVIKDDTIIISQYDAISTLYSYYLQKKNEVLSIVQKYDNTIGIRLIDNSIENRLWLASKTSTPWQFNYALRGGWQTMIDLYNSICTLNNRDLLIAAISVSQILKLDHSSDFDWICNELHTIDCSLSWTTQDLLELINKSIVLSDKDTRIVHIESANLLVAHFLESSEKKKKEILIRFIEANYLNKTFSPLGLVWLANGIRSYCRLYNPHMQLISSKMISCTLDDLTSYSQPEERSEVAYFFELITRTNKTQYDYYFDKHEETIIEWIENSDSITAFAYSRLVNTILCINKKLHHHIVSQINWKKLQDSFLSENNPNYYTWSRLFDRLLCMLTKDERISIGKQIDVLICSLSSKASILTIAPLTTMYCSLLYNNEDEIRKQIEKNIPVYSNYFKADMLQALDIFDFDFNMYICGYDYWGRHLATKQQLSTARLIVSAIPEKEFANVIENCYPRNWHSIRPIMNIIQQHDTHKAKRITQLIDLDTLSKSASSCWDNASDIAELCDVLSYGDMKVARTFIDQNSINIHTVFSVFIVLSPITSIRLFDEGKNVELIIEHWWGLGLRAVKKLLSVNRVKALNIIGNSIDNIVHSANSITALDCNDRDCLDFFELLKYEAPSEFRLITNSIDKQLIKSKWSTGAIYPRKKKIVSKRKEQLFSLLEIE